MRPISQELFGFKEPSYSLVSLPSSDNDNANRFSIKSATDTLSTGVPTQISRVVKSELELTYLYNPIVFNSVNKIVQTIMSANHIIKANDPNVKSYFDRFTGNLGNSGSEITWEGLLSTIFKYQCIYGDSWIENIYNVKKNRIVDWDIIDPKKMDYAKDSMGRVIFDQFSRPIGFTLTMPSNITIPPERLKYIPTGVSLPNNSFFLTTDKIAHIKMYSVGDGVYPIGLIEPIYKTSLRKMNMEDALANAVYRHGFPIVVAKIGDSTHDPTPNQIKSVLDKLSGMSYKQELAVPYYYDLQILESKKAEKLREHLEYYKEQEIAGLGIPRPYATGSGADENRAVLDSMSNLFELTLKDIIAATAASIRANLFAPICKLEGFTEVPTLEWDIVGVDEYDNKIQRIISYVEKGILVPDEKLVAFIKKSEQLE